MTNNRRYTNEQIIDALKKARGMVYVAARTLGCNHNTIYNRMRQSPEVRLAAEYTSGITTDIAELKLFEAIERGEPWAVAFYLKTKGKDRGYTERREVSGPEGGSIVIDSKNLEAAQNQLDEWRQQQLDRIQQQSLRNPVLTLPISSTNTDE
jgi:hypothetical protein